jgi:hypothetical protein
MLKPLTSIAVAVTSLWCTCYGLPPEPPRVTEAEAQQIRPVIYAYIAQHHMPDTIIELSRGSRGEVEVRSNEDRVFIVRKFTDQWKVIRVQKADIDRDIVR